MAVTTTGPEPNTEPGGARTRVATLHMNTVAVPRRPPRVMGPRRPRRPIRAIGPETAGVGPAKGRVALKEEVGAGLTAPTPARMEQAILAPVGRPVPQGERSTRANAATEPVIGVARQLLVAGPVRTATVETVVAGVAVLPAPRLTRTVA